MATTVRASSQFSSGGTTDVAPAAPAGTTTGDLVIVVVDNNSNSTVTDNNGSTPFTKDFDLNANGTTGLRGTVWSRRIQAGDPSTYHFSVAFQRCSAIAVTFQNPNVTTIYDVVPTSTTASSTSGSAPTITTNTSNAIHCACMLGDNATNTITATPAGYNVEQNTGANQVSAFTDKVIVAAGATGAQSFTLSVTGDWIGISVAIADIGGAVALVTGWQNYSEDLPRRRRIIDEPQALALTPATLPVPISGIAWYATPEPRPPKRRPIDDAAWAPQPITQAVTAPPNGWFNSGDAPARSRRQAQADTTFVPQPLATPSIAWMAQPDIYVKRAASRDAAPAWVPPPPPAPLAGWFMSWSDPTRAARRRDDENPTFVPAPQAPASTISGMAWYAPPEPYPRRIPPPEPPAALVLTPATLPVGISGMGWAAPLDLPQQKRRQTDETLQMSWIAPMSAPVTANTSEWIIRARRRGLRSV